MPLGFPVPKRRTLTNPSNGSQFRIDNSDIVTSEVMTKGGAVALVDLGTGTVCYCPCSAKLSEHGLRFFGFLQENAAAGASPTVIFARGAILEPQVEGNVPLTVGQPVFLSLTLGKVTQATITDTDAVSLCVGYAVSEKAIVFITDNRFLL